MQTTNRLKVVNGKVGEGIPFERIRRCTGYLTGDYKRTFNDAKQAEVADRVVHQRLEHQK